MYVGLLAGDQQEILVALGAARFVESVEFVEAQIGQIARMAVAVEVHYHRGVDAHLL